MLIFGTQQETLPVGIKRDPTTGLPLLQEQGPVLQHLLAYLALPYSVTEYGCGKKASVIIDQLLALGIPSFAISRFLMLEADMSPSAMAETDGQKREHALIANNLLANLVDTSDQRLRTMLSEFVPDAELLADASVRAGPYVLHGKEQVQFVTSRSHVSAAVIFWDSEKSCPFELIIDPSLVPDRLLAPNELRDILSASEALIFRAPLLARFRLEPDLLTARQQTALTNAGYDQSVDFEQEAELVRELTGAEQGSIGDPETWTYANNLDPVDDDADTDREHFRYQQLITGQGDELRIAREELLAARLSHSEQTSEILARLRDIEKSSGLLRRCLADAIWSRQCLQPLADVATVFVYYNSLRKLANLLQAASPKLETILTDNARLHMLRGLGVRLHRRIDWLANSSITEDGVLDSRALSTGFNTATIETIRQMNLAGLAVYVDKVGNIHGLLVTGEQRRKLESG